MKATKVDKGSINRGGPEKSATTSRINGMGSNEACYGTMKANLTRTAESNAKPPAPRGKSERGPGGFE